MSDIVSEIRGQIEASKQYLSIKREYWDEAERLFHSKLNDQTSSKTKSQVFDPKLATLIIERSYRVMSQIQTGKVVGKSSNDKGDALLKNLLLDKYIIPNANAQFDFLTKMRMVNMYSNIYGNFFALVDWDVKKNGYVGPDIWLLNIRDVFPQIGAVSINDSDYINVRTWKPLSYFESLRKDKDYININEVIEKLKNKKGSKDKRTSDDYGSREANAYTNNQSETYKGYFEVITRYERDRWIDIVPDADKVIRDQPNPHENGELPVVCKYSIPLLDDFMGMGDLERGKPMQMVINSVWNLYLDAVKMSIFPPILINKDNIAVNSSIKMEAAAKWLVRNQISNAATPLQLNPQGISTFNNVFQVATSSLLNLFGTTDTTTTSQTDPGFGKTPVALEMQKNRENTRDNADRFYQEQFLKEVMTKFVNLMCKKQTGAVAIRMFEDEIDEIARTYPEIKEQYDPSTGKLRIKKGKDAMLYDYEIVSGSTYAADQKQQQQNMALLMDIYQKSQTPNGNLLVEQLKQEGYEFKFGELFKRMISNSGIQDWDKILTEYSDEEKTENLLGQAQQQFEYAVSQMMNNPQATPEQQIPQEGAPYA